MSLLRELDSENVSARPLPRVLQSLSDEVQVMMIEQYGGRARELAMCMTKLEEARMWAIAHGERTGSHVVLDKREMLGNMNANAADGEMSSIADGGRAGSTVR